MRWSLWAFVAGILGGGQGFPAGPDLIDVTFHPPSNTVRFYHATVSLSKSRTGYEILETRSRGKPEVYFPFVEGVPWQRDYTRDNGSVDPNIPSEKEAALHIRCPWKNGREETLEVVCRAEGEDATRVLAVTRVAPSSGGFPFPGWSEHLLLVLSEDFGLARENEPVVTFLTAKRETVGSWENELRVARYDFVSGEAVEIPSQVLSENSARDTPGNEAEYTTCEVAFLADSPPNAKVGYLFIFGNPSAAKPDYSSTLVSRRDASDAITIENPFYEIALHKESGQINDFVSTVFGTGEKNGFGCEKYRLHYNPDCWAKGRDWSHTNKWNPPPNEVWEEGPVAIRSRRWGPLPWVPEVEVQVVYHFFDRVPYVLVDSTIDIVEDVVANALRNEEIVIEGSDTAVDHIGWRRKNGEVVYKPAELAPGLSRGMLGIVEPDATYVALVSERNHFGIAGIRLSQFAGSRGKAPPVVANTMTVFADYGWDFKYWSRSLVYPWGDKAPDIPTVLNSGTFYSEKSAYLLFPLGEGDSPQEKLAYLEELYPRLQNPLGVGKQGAGPW